MGVFLQGGVGRGSERWKGQWERTKNAASASRLTPYKGSQQVFGVSSDHREDSRVTSQRCFLDSCLLPLLQPLPSVPEERCVQGQVLWQRVPGPSLSQEEAWFLPKEV